MEPFICQIDVDLIYDIGSPPDGMIDPYSIHEEKIFSHNSVWMSKEGPTDGSVTNLMLALFPPFNIFSEIRRKVFGLILFGDSSNAVNLVDTVDEVERTVNCGNILITTHSKWTKSVSQTIVTVYLDHNTDQGQGSWFACEGELQEDFRVGVKSPGGTIVL